MAWTEAEIGIGPWNKSGCLSLRTIAGAFEGEATKRAALAALDHSEDGRRTRDARCASPEGWSALVASGRITVPKHHPTWETDMYTSSYRGAAHALLGAHGPTSALEAADRAEESFANIDLGGFAYWKRVESFIRSELLPQAVL
jgi:hypothetical protein